MTYEERKEQVKSYLGKNVKIKIDRPIGYVHKKENYTLTYPVNYGYIPDVIGGDGEELDVYLLSVIEPVEEYTARVIAIAHRENDVEDKLIAVPDVFPLITEEQIKEAINFQEQYYDTSIEMLDIKIYDCTAQHCKVSNLPPRAVEICTNGLVMYTGKHRFTLFTFDDFKKIMDKMKHAKMSHDVIRSICSQTENIEGERGLFLAVYHAIKQEHPELSPDVVFHLQIAIFNEAVLIKIVKIED